LRCECIESIEQIFGRFIQNKQFKTNRIEMKTGYNIFE